jgi:hypothetical protein
MSKQRHAALRRQSTVLRITKSLARLTLPLVPLRIYNPVYAVRRYGETIRDLWRYRTMDGAEPIRITNLRPCIFDKTSTSEGGSEYLYQDTWAAGKIFLHKPAFHVDVASTIYLVTIVSQFTKTLSIDFRPLLVDLPNLLCLGADMCSLPLENDSLESL